MKRDISDLQIHTRKQRHQRKQREPHGDGEGEIYTEQRGGVEEEETDMAPDPVYEEEEERSGDDGWEAEEDDDGEGETEEEDVEMERERQREEWERRRAEMERGRERESGEPYPYPPHFYLKVLSHPSRPNKHSVMKYRWCASNFLSNRVNQVKEENRDQR